MNRPESHTRHLRLVCVTGNALCVTVQHIFSTLAHRPNRIRPLSPQPHVQAGSQPTNTCGPESNVTLTRLSIARQDHIGAGEAGGLGSRHRSVLRTNGRVINTFAQREIKSSGARRRPVVRARRGGRSTATIQSN
jgi:hypothetical protein